MEIETVCESVEVASVLRAPRKLRVCPECNEEFMPRYGNQACCSDECQAARTNRLKKLQDAKRCLYRDQTTELAFRKARREKAARRAEFFAARDAAFEKAGQPVPRIEERGGVRVERRGTCVGGTAFNPSVPISTKSYYYR